ncbi:TetR/AcrR family transcriptional regulator [Nonomuraea typhae]|uniref:TetR/AcrR family transcriptional regulator n=1 Tax=Nonomuraea typhae TaxID=2603600 RepID=A0ABW7YV08_9ACTN
MTAARRTQEERSTATRALLLDATIDCLVAYGYSGTTTMRVAGLAGVSRGAMVHHYATKADLVLAAVEHLAERQLDAARTGFARLREADDWAETALELIWEAHQGPLFEAGVELLVAARTDPLIRARLAECDRAVTAGLTAALDDRVREESLLTVLDAVRGLRMRTFLQPGQTSGWQRLRGTLHGTLTH